MKRAKLAKVESLRQTPEMPKFLRPHVIPEEEAVEKAPKSLAYRPGWGFRKGDTVVGEMAHAKDWSLHSITPVDYKDIAMGTELEGIEQAGSQAMAAVSNPLEFFEFVKLFNLCYAIYSNINPFAFL